MNKTKELWSNIGSLIFVLLGICYSLNFFYQEIKLEHKVATITYIKNEYEDNSSKGLDSYTTVVSATFPSLHGVTQVNGVRLVGNSFFNEGDKISILWDETNKRTRQFRPYMDNFGFVTLLIICVYASIARIKYLVDYYITLE
ncbi:hypothetical protein G7084_01610 [Weissella coleopterorum]|uniref:DUF3592 domain-containing protein n=1 Tax=Weissella coleopterorum TaxID=2714949 RepID=A0A6G8AYF3_9LACO|nr:hypothetical protein [Weissella coleopterorum]QIL50131.1 hypothetical protein G7084_01610 [Weissella coleopterorum]